MTTETISRKVVEPGIDWVDGVCVEKDMGALSDESAMLLGAELLLHVRRNRLGKVFGQGGGYQFPELDGGRLRFPDVSLVREGRITSRRSPEKWLTFAPDLVVESVSPNDTMDDVIAKAYLWMDSGVRLVWILLPVTRDVMVMKPGAEGRYLPTEAELDGEDVVPGFRIRVGDIFPVDDEE